MGKQQKDERDLPHAQRMPRQIVEDVRHPTIVEMAKVMGAKTQTLVTAIQLAEEDPAKAWQYLIDEPY